MCRVHNHSPICSCNVGFVGDPFRRCDQPPPRRFLYLVTRLQDYLFLIYFVAPQQYDIVENVDPCYPTPCGPHSQCRNSNGSPSCSCLSTYIGAPPNCRPECTINQDCVSNLACIRDKCQDPCLGACGLNAICSVRNHVATCSCLDGFNGNPFATCQPTPLEPSKNLKINNKLVNYKY